MILAAGLGTRLKPLTNSIPKALIKIKGFTVLELQIRKLRSEGFNKIVINVHHFAEQVKDHLAQNNFFDTDISISDESQKLLDTGGGLKKASHFFSDGNPFLVQNVDILSDISLKKLMNLHKSSGNPTTLAISQRNSSRKFLFSKNEILSGWMNEKTGEKKIARKDGTDLVPYSFSGIQIIDPSLFKYFPDKDIFSLVEFYLSAAEKEPIKGFLHDDDYWIDLGKPENIIEAEKKFVQIRNIYQV